MSNLTGEREISHDVPKSKGKVPHNTDILKCIAIILITNSHLDHLYPWPYLGTGGALGNALFFMLSGYGLALSFDKSAMKPPFLQWARRRISRIYPSVWITLVLF